MKTDKNLKTFVLYVDALVPSFVLINKISVEYTFSDYLNTIENFMKFTMEMPTTKEKYSIMKPSFYLF